MISTITGKEMSLQIEERVMLFRKEDFTINFQFYLCEESGNRFTTTMLDEVNLEQLYNRYRVQHNILFPEQIRELRARYYLSASMMAKILGFGPNTYTNYEKGEVPNKSNNNLLKLVQDPTRFIALVRGSDDVSEDLKDKIIRKINKVIELNIAKTPWIKNEDLSPTIRYILASTFSRVEPIDLNTGYRAFSWTKLVEMVVFFTGFTSPFKTSLNKLLFYADFTAFKRSCYSISGVKYRAIEWGPVVDGFQTIFERIVSEGHVDLESVEFDSGAIGDRFIAVENRKVNTAVFNALELEVLEMIVNRFKGFSAAQISATSHKEQGWLENNDRNSIISYDYGFYLLPF
ncbi:MAG: DUF4065 domain-containing protein [Saprospiraceae bacterium]|nr:DUF4065 domain-containing protein [Saprospiraceae bacterium]